MRKQLRTIVRGPLKRSRKTMASVTFRMPREVFNEFMNCCYHEQQVEVAYACRPRGCKWSSREATGREAADRPEKVSAKRDMSSVRLSRFFC